MDDIKGLFQLLGSLSADMKHVLRSLETNRVDTARLREEVYLEVTNLREDMHLANDNITSRLSKVERFNTRVLAYASVALPVLLAVVQWGVPFILMKL